MADGDGVQPSEGQGAAPYAEYLDRIPEELRAQVEPVFKEWDGNVTQRFQEAAEFRRQMEPFTPLVEGRQPDEIQWGLQFHDAAVNHPEALKEWWDAYAKEHGLSEQEAEALADELENPEIGQALQSQLAPIAEQVQALAQRFEQQDQQQRLGEAQQMIEQQMAEQKERLGDLFNKDAIEGLVGKYIETDPANAITRAAADWEQIANQLRADAVQGKLNTSIPAPESGGAPDGTPPKVSSFAEATRLATERLQAAIGQQ